MLVIFLAQDDVLSIAFTYPKALCTAASDGNVCIFDIESGARRLVMAPPPAPSTGNTPRRAGSSTAELTNNKYIEKVIFLEGKNKTIVCVGGDGHIRFWEGMCFLNPPPPPPLSLSATPFLIPPLPSHTLLLPGFAIFLSAIAAFM
jgi:WD40 repeat protein